MKKLSLLFAVSVVATSAFAQSFSESFDAGVYTPASITSDQTWVTANMSSPIGTTNWFNGNPTVFTSHAGASYAGTNFNNGSGLAEISNWMFSPVRTFNNNDTISFFTRTVNSPFFPDRLHLRLSTNGASTNVGGAANTVGDFSTILLTVNAGLTTAGYPNVWTQFTGTVTGLGGPTSGRFAFHYHMPNAGPSGSNSDYIGIDTVQYTAVPEPGSMIALGLGAAALIARRRKARKA